jgi:exodeoxyribonuclease-5
MVELSQEQTSAKDAVLDWYYGSKQELFTLGGYAGTGKTTLLGYIRNQLPRTIKVAFCCFTAKAGSVLKSKLNDTVSIRKTDFCGTIHSLIYKPIIDEETDKIIGWERKESAEVAYDLIVIDEASMVGESIYRDLASYAIPILAVGDCFQLPPIEGEINLMDRPDVTLEKIHRQAEGNPIIMLSMDVRNCGYIREGSYGGKVAKVRGTKHTLVQQFIANTKSFNNTMILCAFNKTRVRVNESIRRTFGNTGRPCIGERVICLRNNYNAQDCVIVNGAQGFITEIADANSHWEMIVKLDGEDEQYFGAVDKATFGNDQPEFTTRKVQRFRLINHLTVPEIEIGNMDYFDFGYCLSVHKSQGSQADRVMVIEERSSAWSQDHWARWLYTAITRASDQLLVVQR